MEGNGVTVEVQKVEGRADALVFNCVGYIDTYNAQQVSQIVNAKINNGTKNLIFDLSEVTYISSFGIGIFIAFLKAVKPENGDVILVGMANRVLDVFSLLGFSAFFTRTDSLNEALDYLPKEKVPVSNIQFKKMEDIVGSFDKLERFVIKEKQREFYEELIRLLRQIQGLKN